MRRRALPGPFRLLLAAGLAAQVAIQGLACGGKGHKSASDAGVDDGGLSDVTYETADVSPAAVAALLAVPPTRDDVHGAHLLTPPLSATMTLDGANIPQFLWSPAAGRHERRPPRVRWASLQDLALGGERSALASGVAFSGVAYVLVFSDADNPQLMRVATSSASYVPSSDAWGVITHAAGPITLTIISGSFSNDALLAGGGPFTATMPFTFSVNFAPSTDGP